MKLRFFVSKHRRNSLRDKVVSKKWVYQYRMLVKDMRAGKIALP